MILVQVMALPVCLASQWREPPYTGQPHLRDRDESISDHIYEVTLCKGPHGLGFTVAGGQHTPGFFYVKDVLYHPALTDGRIKSGDRLLMVDGCDMTGLNHSEAVEFLRQTPQLVTLVFYRDEVVDESVVTTPTIQTPGDSSTVENNVKRTAHNTVESDAASLTSSFGNITLPMSDIDQQKETKVQEPVQATPAESTVSRVQLSRPSGGSLGFTLVQAGKGLSSALYVKNISPHGVAAQDGRLRVGDRLLQVNGQSVLGMPHNKAVALIKSHDTVKLAVSSRPSSTVRRLDDMNIHAIGLADDYSIPGWSSSDTEQSGSDQEPIEPVSVEPVSVEPVSVEPVSVTSEWLSSLTLITAPVRSVHYQGRELVSTSRDLQRRLEVNDPAEEFKDLKRSKLTDNCIAARKTENKAKNRFRNVLPYDATRVFLDGSEDYINASHITYQVDRVLHEYIATQGPLPETTADFWSMVWQFQVKVIAMVMQDTEAGKVKFYKYWPGTRQPLTIRDTLQVSLVTTQALDHFDVHTIEVIDLLTGASLTVTHLNYTSWPDHGTPPDPLPFLQYIKVMNLSHQSGPIVVHCSAGIGRSGVLITVDIVRVLIEADLKFDVLKIVQEIRKQRQGMIQTKDQYRFCYEALLKYLELLRPTD